jgi:hypothetical protein
MIRLNLSEVLGECGEFTGAFGVITSLMSMSVCRLSQTKVTRCRAEFEAAQTLLRKWIEQED